MARRGDAGGGHSSGADCGGHGGGRGERGEIGGEGDNCGGGIGEGGGGGGSDGGGGWDGSGGASSDTAGGHRVARGAAPAGASPLHQLALYYKRVLEQAVLRAHPEWAGSHVGEEVRLRAPPAAALPSCAFHSQCISQSAPNGLCPRPDPPPTLSDVFCHGVRLSSPLSHLALSLLPPPHALRLFTPFKVHLVHLSRTGASLLRLSVLRSTLAHAPVAPGRRSLRCQIRCPTPVALRDICNPSPVSSKQPTLSRRPESFVLFISPKPTHTRARAHHQSTSRMQYPP